MPRIGSAERARLDPKERQRRKQIAEQKIAIRVEGSEIYKLVKRIKLEPKEINDIFECNAWYIKEESSGDVIWPEDWMNNLNPSTEQNPWRYMIVERDHFPRFDQAPEGAVQYSGDATIWVENVPYEVQALALVRWVQGGLEASLPHIRKSVEKVEVYRDKFEFANADVNDCEKQVAKDADEAHYKALRLAALGAARGTAQAKHLAAQAEHAAAVNALRAEPVEATPVLRDPAQAKALWEVTFARQDRADYVMSEIPTEVWDSVRLSQPQAAQDGSGHGGFEPFCLPPIALGTPDPRTNLKDEIVMRGAAFKRFRHGKGRERKVGEEESARWGRRNTPPPPPPPPYGLRLEA